MGPALTGEAAALYLGVIFDAANAGVGIDSRKLARDALLARRSNRNAIGRLRLAHARVTARPRPPRPCLARAAGRVPRRRFHVETSAGGTRGRPKPRRDPAEPSPASPKPVSGHAGAAGYVR